MIQAQDRCAQGFNELRCCQNRHSQVKEHTSHIVELAVIIPVGKPVCDFCRDHLDDFLLDHDQS